MIYICIRRTTEWEDEKIFLSQLSDEFRPKVETWNNTFDMPYHVFRHRIKQIAQQNLSKVADSVCATIENVPEGAMVVPIDDDDWLAPHIAGVLEKERENGKIGYYWNKDYLNMPATNFVRLARFILYDLTGRQRNRWTCSTNNYAFINNQSLLSTQCFKHTKASAYFDQNGAKVKQLPDHLSMMNRTIASQTSMNWRKARISNRRLIKNYYLYRDMYKNTLLPHHEWSKPYLMMMSDLMRELRPKRM